MRPTTRLRVALLTSICLVGMAGGAWASTVPPLDADFGGRRGQVAIGLPDLNVDFVLADGLSAGLSIFLTPSPSLLAARTTYRLVGSEEGWWHAGLTLSAGTATGAGFYDGGGWSPLHGFHWIQPAGVLSASLLADRLAVRATLGPAFLFASDLRLMEDWLVPNLELAYRFTRDHELTIGGNSLVGMRWYLMPRRGRQAGGRDGGGDSTGKP